MKLKMMIGSVALLGVVLAACSTAPNASVAAAEKATSKKIDRGEFQDAVRKLWEDHVTWTRLYIVSAAAGLPDAQLTAERLLRNQDDIGNAVKPFYGEEAGAKLTALLRTHILQAADLLTAAKAGDTAEVGAVKTAWYENGDEIAAFLSSANPTNWPLEAVQHHMRMHLDLTLDEAVKRLEGNYAADIALYDEVHDAILQMADIISAGIQAQFPERFN